MTSLKIVCDNLYIMYIVPPAGRGVGDNGRGNNGVRRRGEGEENNGRRNNRMRNSISLCHSHFMSCQNVTRDNITMLMNVDWRSKRVREREREREGERESKRQTDRQTKVLRDTRT